MCNWNNSYDNYDSVNGTDKMGCGVSKSEKNSAEVPEHLLATQMAMNGMKVIIMLFYGIFLLIYVLK